MMFGIGYVNKPIEPCTEALFWEKVKSKVVADTCDLIARLEKRLADAGDMKKRKWAEQNIAQAKRSLPCITPMAYFKDNKRSTANAIPSGLNMIDVDHVDKPRELWEQISRKQLPYKVALVHVTPSGRGLRIIFVQPGLTAATDGQEASRMIADGQTEMAKACGVQHDEVTKDLARCSFLVKEEYVLFIDNNTLFMASPPARTYSDVLNIGLHREGAADASTSPLAPQGGIHLDSNESERGSSDNSIKEASPLGGCGAEKASSAPAPSLLGRAEGEAVFKGIPYSEIIKCILFAMSYDETPTEGERNNALYGLARNLRYICDFNVDFIISVIPDWGLSADEVRRTVTSAVGSVRKTTMPKQLATIINNLSKQYLTLGEQYSADWDYVVEPKGIIGEFVKLQPKYLKNACYLACMASFGTLLTRLRGRAMNGDKIAPNFMLTISAPQASGKSFMKKVFEQICHPIFVEDQRQMDIENDIKKENKRNANKEGYEDKEFEGAIRLLPTNTSNRVLLERMDKAKNQHLMICAEEIDSITKAEKSGRWSEKSDVYRLAYDNSLWGQDYASDNSYHAVVHLYLNLMFSGTPAAVGRFFNDVEDGLITRFLFCDLPDTYGQKRPKIMYMDEKTQKRVEARLQSYFEMMNTTSDENGEIWIDTSKMVADVDEFYDDVQRRMYLVNQLDPSRDVARRRYADYAVKMMMIETYLNNGVYTEDIRDRVIGVINYCTEQLLALFGDDINKSLNESIEMHEAAMQRSKKRDMLEALPNRFTTQEFNEHAISFGYSRNSVNTVVKRLVTGGLLVRLEHGLYEKC